MKIFTKKEILPIILIISAFGIGVFLYPDLPDKIPSHWNVKGEIDSWSGRNFGVFFFPVLTLAVYLLMLFVPLLDPLKKSYEKFAAPYFWLRTILVTFFILLYFYSLLAAMGEGPNINNLIIPAFSLLFVFLGLFLPKVKKNYFVGIRTPWTLASEEVWDKTHKIGGKAFLGAGILSFVGMVFPDYSFQIFISAVLAAAIFSFAVSYFIFRKIKESV